MDTGFERYSDDLWLVYSDERKWVNRILALAKLYPDDVKIASFPEENDGNIIAYVPKKWIKISPPRKERERTIEEKAALVAQLKAGKEKKKHETVKD